MLSTPLDFQAIAASARAKQDVLMVRAVREFWRIPALSPDAFTTFHRLAKRRGYVG